MAKPLPPVLHCPYRQATLLQQALSPDKMKVSFMLGAGCPVSIRVMVDGVNSPLIPDVKGLTEKVSKSLESSAEHKSAFTKIKERLIGGSDAEPNIEILLSHLRSMCEVVKNGEIDGLNKKMLLALDSEICKLTTDVVSAELPAEITPYHQLATWINGITRPFPVEIFTTNYDLLMEQALESRKVPYFDGFVGSKHPFFDLASMELDTIPHRWARLWKVHGSINWWRTESKEVERRITGVEEERQMIYPSHLKYDQSRRMPYLAMLDRLKSFLSRGQAVLVTCGYSFSDSHINEIILNGLRSNPSAICFGLLHGKRASSPQALADALETPNLNLLASDGAVLGTIEGDWKPDSNETHPFHDLAIATDVSNGEDVHFRKFLLGDFKTFGEFLARQLNRFEDEQAPQHAP